VAPNKRLEDVLTTFYALKHLRPQARLLIVGATSGMAPYVAYLQALIARLGLADVVFSGHVNQAEWLAYYRTAQIYLSLSEHEGFCIPLLESMHFNLPIVAYKAAAVPETLGQSGLLVQEKDPLKIAGLLDVLLSQPALRASLLQAQRRRLQDFLPAAILPRLKTLITAL
jgi:glycosyltransferase involved in cell wall biosynthesis